MVTTVLAAVPNGALPGDCPLVEPESVGGIWVPGVGRPVISRPFAGAGRGFAVALLGGGPGEVEGICEVGRPEIGETPAAAGARVNPGGSASVEAPLVASRPPAAFCGAVFSTERLGMLELMFGAPDAVVPVAVFIPGLVEPAVAVELPLVALLPAPAPPVAAPAA